MTKVLGVLRRNSVVLKYDMDGTTIYYEDIPMRIAGFSA